MIGTGNIGKLHLEAYERHMPEVLVAVVEIDVECRDDISARVHKVYDDVEDAILDGYDVYDICLPTFLHYEVLATLLRKTSSYILCEKPLVLSIEELSLLKAIPGFDARVKCAFVERFNEPFYLAKKWCERHQGPFDITLERRTKNVMKNGWLSDPKFGGDVMLDLAIHDIDAAVWWVGTSVDRVQGYRVDGLTERATMIFANSSRIKIISGWDLPDNHPSGIVNSFMIKSRGDTFVYDGSNETVTLSTGTQTVAPRMPNAYYAEIDAMLASNQLSRRFPTAEELWQVMAAFTLIQKERV